ncbi:MAG: efflux RND transporter periplasmic adaptor subunit [Candidatus Delongbacteria bacterium]|nr:efflux RND transporter periplasmic adaptor subunit [Candidatus Delongbacteria bacterium]
MAKTSGRKSRKKYIIIGVSALILILIVFNSISSKRKKSIIIVQSEKVQKRNITQIVSTTGKINAEYKVQITPEVTGEIVQLPVKEGDIVDKGDLLIRIKPDIYTASKDRASANLQSARSNLNVQKASFEKFKSNYERYLELIKKKMCSQSEFEESQSNYLIQKGQLESQQAQVLQAEATLKEAEENLAKTAIYSPMRGTVSQLNVEYGERVLGSGYSQGTNIMTVSDLSAIEAIVEVDENDVVMIAIGDTATIKIDAFGDKIFQGTVTEISNSATTTGLGTQNEVVNFEVKIRLEAQDTKMRPGMSCTADIQTEKKLNVLSVPIQSVTVAATPLMNNPENRDNDTVPVKAKKEEKPQEIVYLVQNKLAISKAIKTGISDDNYFEVIEGVQEGDEVISGPYRAISKELKDSVKVKVESKPNQGKKQ